ncbi:hypothetical protein BGW37DRAFT_276472 [Umbelopsis sp. PMI_123]|nr:hypothetical protein BGW37DRAFT_276472 [Umbelopsis sp. PMI_123]
MFLFFAQHHHISSVFFWALPCLKSRHVCASALNCLRTSSTFQTNITIIGIMMMYTILHAKFRYYLLQEIIMNYYVNDVWLVMYEHMAIHYDDRTYFHELDFKFLLICI